MTDLDRHAGRLGARLEVSWSDDRVEEALARLHRRRRARRRAVALGTVAAAAVVAFVAGARSLHGGHSARPAAPVAGSPLRPAPAPSVAGAAPAGPAPIALADGSTVTLLDAATQIEAGEISPSAVTIRLRGGAARFHVEHRPERIFRVVAGDVAIVDLGTEFAVTRRDASSLVEVFAGRVRVEWRGGAADMVAGERRVFPPPAAVEPTSPAVATPHRPTVPPPAAPPVEDEDVEALLARADDARFRADPAAAVAPLRRVVDRHPDDARAPLAAFTLGRLYLEALHDPAEAAQAFARARALAPGGQLAEDALAREVEAWARAGDHARAADRARDYLDAYPDGRRAAEVKRSAGLP